MAWHVAMRPGKRRALDKQSPWGSLLEKAEQRKASVRAKVEHPFHVIKCQFGHTKVRYRGLKKNTAQLFTMFMLSNLWMVRKRFSGTTECVRPNAARRSELTGKGVGFQGRRRLFHQNLRRFFSF